MAFASTLLGFSNLGGSLRAILESDDIQPGTSPGYELCKLIYAYHAIGAKLVEKPVTLAQSQDREISVPDSPEERVKEAFEKEFRQLGGTDGKVTQTGISGGRRVIFNAMKIARIYGASALVLKEQGVDPSQPVQWEKLADRKIAFSVFDPLNVAGSLVLNQNPNDFDFLNTTTITVQGITYHPSRVRITLNEDPIFLEYTSAAFGYVGRSVYQRALFSLKGFIEAQVATNMVLRKAGVLVAMMKQAGGIVDGVMARLFGGKRQVLKEARTDNVIGIGIDEKIETLNMQNADVALKQGRQNVLEDIASASGTPAKIITEETFAEGFGEGTEDAKQIAQYVDDLRLQMDPLYEFVDKVTMHRAWSPDFYETIQKEFEEYKDVSYEDAFFRWKNSYRAEWPSLLKEPDSELAKAEDVKLKALIALVQVLMPEMDPNNKALLIQWACDNFNEMKLLFGSPLELDFDEFLDWAVERQQQQDDMQQASLTGGGEGGEPKAAPPFSQRDSAGSKSLLEVVRG